MHWATAERNWTKIFIWLDNIVPKLVTLVDLCDQIFRTCLTSSVGPFLLLLDVLHCVQRSWLANSTRMVKQIKSFFNIASVLVLVFFLLLLYVLHCVQGLYQVHSNYIPPNLIEPICTNSWQSYFHSTRLKT